MPQQSIIQEDSYEALSMIPSIGAPHCLLNDRDLGMPVTSYNNILSGIDFLQSVCKALADLHIFHQNKGEYIAKVIIKIRNTSITSHE